MHRALQAFPPLLSRRVAVERREASWERAAARIGFKRLDGTQLAGRGDVPASDVAAATIAERCKLVVRRWARVPHYLP